ncbi:WS/DGAT domain-containing protein [Mycobacterium sherrisii]|uniref:O-acyltransferase WSD1 C-terminal domain-containing protein n=1 Tax=Mycobacterium sherrisii TaxID=243061 RepID=A0A1E3SPF5_9MYCO|nr:WS/DGAT domain-containing protein [Mycobacterium sherrisii]ODR04020.1 hypothetical protein BHQ21_19355 [Mycobacterium sherrisii]ORW84431.1 hypothetical protein AWC25_24885 [Mycobacterium sherrisii]
MSVALSSVVGPRERGHFVGAAVSEILPTGVLAPINSTVWSYVDQLGMTVLTDDQTLDGPPETTDAMTEPFAELRNAAGVSVTLGSKHGVQR